MIQLKTKVKAPMGRKALSLSILSSNLLITILWSTNLYWLTISTLKSNRLIQLKTRAKALKTRTALHSLTQLLHLHFSLIKSLCHLDLRPKLLSILRIKVLLVLSEMMMTEHPVVKIRAKPTLNKLWMAIKQLSINRRKSMVLLSKARDSNSLKSMLKLTLVEATVTARTITISQNRTTRLFRRGPMSATLTTKKQNKAIVAKIIETLSLSKIRQPTISTHLCKTLPTLSATTLMRN